MDSKVKVVAKAQSRLALGIMHAYMLMNPKATIDDLRETFPDSLNPDSGVKRNLVHIDEKGAAGNWEGYFRGEEEMLVTMYGTKIGVVKMWTKPSLDRIVSRAKDFGIEVEQVELMDKENKKGFRLEYLNGWTPPVPKKGIPAWVWIVLTIAVIAAIVIALL